MNKEVFVSFIKDKLILSILFFLNSLCLFIFFYCTVGYETEFIYPMTISLFIYTVLIINEWNKYSKFYKSIKKSINNIEYDVYAKTNEQKVVEKIINKLHYFYKNKTNDLVWNYKNQQKFIAQWIHNIKTPVTVIDLIIEKCLKDNKNEDLVACREENGKIKSNVENMISLIRLEDFATDYVPRAYNLIESIKSVIKLKKNQFIYNNIFPEIKVKDTEIRILTDRKWNEFILAQIISNAIKYSHENGKRKKLIFDVEKEKRYITLKIKDYGVGIKAYDIERVFQPFFTGDNGRINKGSTGIGLYMCDVIAKKLGHTINIKSKSEYWTEVNITYKLKEEDIY